MYLKELTIHGFKSFAKKSELEFSSSITSIVGPNGSGKSNVAESFRFVLGEQSVKSMRGRKGEDLIWGGSEKISRGNRASVEVVFDNKSRIFALDFDEVKIERVVHRDGQNEYKLNGSSVRLKDIHELLANANIGSTGHHIISQGEADRVLAAGPKERREMIEDALGLKVYQLKKQETQRKLDKTKENISQTESIRREAAPHLKYLKKQVEKAERSIQVQADLRGKYAEYLKREDTYVAHHFDRLTAERNAPEQQLATARAQIAKLKSSIQPTHSQKDTEEIATAKQTLESVRKERQQAEAELNQLEGQVRFLEKRISQAQNQPSTPSFIDRGELEDLVESLENKAQKALQSEEAENLKSALQTLIAELKEFLSGAEFDVTALTADDAKELDALQNEIAKIQADCEAKRAKEQIADDNLTALQTEQLKELEADRDAEKELFTAMNEERELSLKLSKIDSELSVLERDRNEFKRELQEAVALLGRGATDYFSYKIVDGEQLVSIEAIVNEDRSEQRERRRELEKLKIRLEELGVGATEDLMKEYQDAKDRDEFLAKELNDLETSVGNLSELIADMDEKLHEQFSSGVAEITKQFNTFFTLMFGGGSAELKTVQLKSRGDDEEEVDTVIQEGVDLNVSLPNKRVKGLEMLSGGERALTSIALIFAMSQVNPPPFIILDETDAALDEANSRRYGDMIEALAKKSQLVLITHNRETMSRAGILYGITMGGDGVSKVLSVKFDEAAAVAK